LDSEKERLLYQYVEGADMEAIVFTYNEKVDKKFIKGVVGEFLGTFMFLFTTIRYAHAS
jgi:glycerol uptake facilitator-like aquaporin